MTSITASEYAWQAGTLSEFVLDALHSLRSPWGQESGSDLDLLAAQDAERLSRDPLTATIKGLVAPALEAPNGPQLRQTLARIALSPATASLELSFGAVLEVKPEDLRLLPAVFHRAPSRLGSTAANLFFETLGLLHPAVLAMVAENQTTAQYKPPTHRTPEELARLRHKLILGDVLPPSIAEIVLANVRGQVAFLALVVALLDGPRLPEWKAVALGESAVEGMKALQRLTLAQPGRIDLEAAIREHAAWKDELFDQLEAEEQLDAAGGGEEAEKKDAP